MTAEPFPNKRSIQTPSRLVHHFDAYSMWGFVAFMIAATVLSVTDISSGFDTGFWVMAVIQVSYAAAVVVAGRRHPLGLCPHCNDEFPLNPGEAAAGRYRVALAAVHIVHGGLYAWYRLLKRWLQNTIVAYIVFIAVLGVAMWGLAHLLGPWLGVMVLSGVIALQYAQQRHTQLDIWCPWCHDDGDGGDDDDPPDPEPGPEPAVGVTTGQSGTR